jgi:hypothetical protein
LPYFSDCSICAGEGDGEHARAEAERRKRRRERRRSEAERRSRTSGLVARCGTRGELNLRTAEDRVEVDPVHARENRTDPQIRQLAAQLREATAALDDTQHAPLWRRLTRERRSWAPKDPMPLEVLNEEQRKNTWR